jgi:regulatory protein
LDDLAAARSFVRTRAARYGRRRMELELASRGFSAGTVTEALASLERETEETALRRAFEKAWRQARGLPARERRARVARALARKGFAGDAVSAMMRGSHEID